MRGWILAALLSLALGPAAGAQPVHRKKVVKYKKHTQVDFSAQAVEGKIRTPEVFYVFQRKRTEPRRIAGPPERLEHHRPPTVRGIREALGEP